MISFPFVITPTIYWTNAYDTQDFPLFKTELYDVDHHKSAQMNETSPKCSNDRVTSNETAYEDYSMPLLFAAISTGLVHVMIRYGWYLIKMNVSPFCLDSICI
ncbi:hypothetical protein RHMOL_Rhmol05G0030100 [Rhododendron molle]|uniref:Uncharacterized protein n=1 Tax=Rhododendron molle TaxID=49168 RepID=A0ACC0NK80_RHOML|nr:hypothetical protein RHMOL_Rhmol05G0030100 [Rhododendron molle]